MTDKQKKSPKSYAKNFVGTPANIELLKQSLKEYSLPVDPRLKADADAMSRRLGTK